MAYLPNVLSTLSLIFLLFSIKLVHSQLNYTNCSITQETYAPNTAFHQNLKIVLTNLTFAASTTKSSFHNSSFGQNNDTVYGLYLCRGDLSPEVCSSCVTNATQNITEECSSNRESIRWVPECMLRYANGNIFSKGEETPSFIWRITPPVKAPKNATPSPSTVGGFNLTTAIYVQINETAFGNNNSSPTTARYYSTKEFNTSGDFDEQKIYSLAQCTPDISQLMCQKCLAQAYEDLRGSLESLAYFPSCHLRYDLKKFYGIQYPPSPQPALGQPPQTDAKKKRGSSYILIASAVPAAVVAILLLFIFYAYKSNWNVKASSREHEEVTMESIQYDVSTIKAAVNNFSKSNKLGKGGYGEVYKGTLQNGQEIAVKRLFNRSEKGLEALKAEAYVVAKIQQKKGLEAMKAEANVVAKLQHKNLVRLLGFCATEEEKLLIFEYLPFLSLDLLLFDPKKRTSLNWETRYKIIDGIARGLLYLHDDSRYKIVHRDLKPANILLDQDMTPKIADFGLAKIFKENQDQDITEHVAGTKGYMAPEYQQRGNVSTKADVYSFGVIVLEIVSGRRIRDQPFEESLLECAWRLWKTKQPLKLMDSTLRCNFSTEEATRCIQIGLSCTQEEANKRPPMASILSVLDRYSGSPPQSLTKDYPVMSTVLKDQISLTT